MKIQLALDRFTIEQAIAITKRVYPYIDWIEVGTSLIKEFGMESVRALRKEFPGKTIVADIKTFDNAAYEFEMCYAAGADVATVMGASPVVTIETCMNVAVKHGKQVMIDLLNTSDDQLEKLTVYREAIFCAHVSKDQQEITGQKQGLAGIHLPGSRFRDTNRKVALAGGINAESLPSLAKVQPSVVIIGSAITKAQDPVLAARTIKALTTSAEGGTSV
ncbi:3-hexulose-6-phosphate synthase [Paenactinomyces guangxiensis]|uniref:3-hexulose-6-phosphate synthase n=1 Tax=Paenactinomyces guangxiensis TaxID=1490290 RepID=A0A7W2A7J0_9BACL|nr:3-hexulose-6-phosphate synthase [Paenactinomyces guangxiensis]MBA4493187.1 orotidine 5'-phosphate decarboxylase [Paenactinomyces guangxiensis]MBH8589963.1 orotidine 5'-phosphate decarboxylase [Paenactinomyces guangxiensis]